MKNIEFHPKILKLDYTGIPREFIHIEEAISYYAKDMILFEAGNPIATYHGGFNQITNKQSIITANSIISVKGKCRNNVFQKTPTLTNEALFERDLYLCAYCGEQFLFKDLSRDHVKPISKGGDDVWSNVVTACVPCNTKKGNKLLHETSLELIYLPYTPDFYEYLILKQGQKKILADQMEYLINNLSNKSRIKQRILLETN